MSDEPKQPEPESPLRPIVYNAPQGSNVPAWLSVAGILLLSVSTAYQTWRNSPGPTPVPTPAPVVVVETKPTIADSIAETNGERNDAIKAQLVGIIEHGNGTHTLTFQPDKKKKVTWTVAVSGGGKPLPPVPVPVPPGPPVPPDPPKPDVVSGPRGILIIQQVENESDAFSAMMVKLRSGASAEYLKSKGHKLYHLDPDDTGANGQPSEIVEAWRPHFKDLKLPVEIIFDPATKQLLSKRELPDTTTDANVIESVRQQGG